MNQQILKMNIGKWLEACRFLKSKADTDLDSSESTSVSELADFWRLNYSQAMVDQCNEHIESLKGFQKYHGNDREIIEKSKEMCSIASIMLKNEADFNQFKAEMMKLARPPRRPAPQQQAPHRPSPQPQAPRRPTPVVGQNPSAPRRFLGCPIKINSVTFNTFEYPGANSLLQEDVSWVWAGAPYISVVVRYDVIEQGPNVRLWYKIYNASNQLIYVRPGISGESDVPRDSGSLKSFLIGIGDKNGDNFGPSGMGRVEIYYADALIYTQPVEFRPRPVRQQPQPRRQPPVQNHSGGGNSGGSGGSSGLKIFLIIAAILIAGYFAYTKFFADSSSEFNYIDSRYVLADKLSFRSSPDDSGYTNVMQMLDYGSYLSVLDSAVSQSGKWLKVKYSGREGYVSSDYVVNKNEFDILKSVADASILEEVKDTRCRRALIDAARQGGYAIIKSPKSQGDVVEFPNLRNGYDYYVDFAFILTDTSGDRTALIYSFTPEQEPRLVYSESTEGFAFRSIRYNNGKYTIRYYDIHDLVKETNTIPQTSTPVSPASSPVAEVATTAAAEPAQSDLLSSYKKRLPLKCSNQGVYFDMTDISMNSDKIVSFRFKSAKSMYDMSDNELKALQSGVQIFVKKVVSESGAKGSSCLVFDKNNRKINFADANQSKNEEVYRSVEQMPQFPGGESKLRDYIAKHLKYPAIAVENNVQGRVIVQFVVTKNGSIGEVKVIRSVDRYLDAEAVRVVKSLPKFIPGKMGGKAVNVWYTLPITFNLR